MVIKVQDKRIQTRAEGSYVCVYILVFCIFITFYFRSIVSCGLWVPMFVFIFLYFVSFKHRNPQSTRHNRSEIKGDKDTKYKNINTNIGTHSPQDTIDLLFQIYYVLWTVGSYVCVYILVFCIFITFYFRSIVSCGLWVPMFVFIFLYLIQEYKHTHRNPQSTRHKGSKIKGDLDTKYKNINTNIGTHSTQDTNDLK
jgi:cobalamin biosynthesis protein CobD/CbiB